LFREKPLLSKVEGRKVKISDVQARNIRINPQSLRRGNTENAKLKKTLRCTI
jgi:hypothetical protein